MLHLAKTKTGKFIVVAISGANGKVISTSELLNKKGSGYANIKAQCKVLDTGGVYWQDDTGKKPVVNFIDVDGVMIANVIEKKPEKRYVPVAKKKK